MSPRRLHEYERDGLTVHDRDTGPQRDHEQALTP